MEKLFIQSTAVDGSAERVVQCQTLSSELTNVFSGRKIKGFRYNRKTIDVIVEGNAAFAITASKTGMECNTTHPLDCGPTGILDTSNLPEEFCIHNVKSNRDTVIEKKHLIGRKGHEISRIIQNPSQLLLYISSFPILCFNCHVMSPEGFIITWYEEIEVFNRTPRDLEYLQYLNRRIAEFREGGKE